LGLSEHPNLFLPAIFFGSEDLKIGLSDLCKSSFGGFLAFWVLSVKCSRTASAVILGEFSDQVLVKGTRQFGRFIHLNGRYFTLSM
jgi:hypothetical protein